VENLLDPDRLRRIARLDGDHLGGPAALATRDEVDAYERELRRKRFGAAGMAAGLALAVAGVGAAVLVPREARPSEVEIEPNDTAAEATPLTLGRPVHGTLGRRLDATHGDRDFYAFDLPAAAPGAPTLLRLRVSALSSIATCTLLYRAGFPDPVGRYCAGRPGRDLFLPALSLAPGRYLLAVLQDLDPYGGPPTYVQESISDRYTLLAEPTSREPGTEIEPNDQVASATVLSLDEPVAAAIGWARDEDVFCVSAAEPLPFRWRLRAGARDPAVLEATPLRGEAAGAPVRIHADEVGPRAGDDVQSPWQSVPQPAEGAPRCLRVRLAGDPGGGSQPYVVEAARVL
jgi:hypothetical protein